MILLLFLLFFQTAVMFGVAWVVYQFELLDHGYGPKNRRRDDENRR